MVEWLQRIIQLICPKRWRKKPGWHSHLRAQARLRAPARRGGASSRSCPTRPTRQAADERLPDSQASPIPALGRAAGRACIARDRRRRPALCQNEAPKPAPCRSSAYPSNIDVEALTQNFARLIEEGGRAVAAYLKPREDGTKKVGYSDEVADAVKTLGQVMEYWYADPQRTVEMQTRLGKSYLGSVRERVAAARRRAERAGRQARSARQALQRSRMVVEPVFRLPQAGLSRHRRLGEAPRRRRRPARPGDRARRPNSTCARSSTRSRRRISSSPIRSCCAPP